MFFIGGFLEDIKWKPPLDPIGFLKWLFVFFTLLWLIWFFTGGPARYEERRGAFLKPPSPLDTGEVYGPDGNLLEGGTISIGLGFEEIDRGLYTFEAPKSWTKSRPQSVNGCLWDGIANDTSDGHRMAGEIGIYDAKCFSLASAQGKKEYTEKSGYYIVSYYDESTTPAETAETKSVYAQVVKTFKIK